MHDLTPHFEYMALALFVAFRALQNGETPVACVFVHEPTGKILSYGCNDTNRSLNGTRHAEFMAIDEILAENGLLGAPSAKVADFFKHVTLYVTIEPCVMCALALLHVGIGKVYFGAANDRFGGNGTVIKAQGNSYLSIGGIMRPEAITLLRNFYVQENLSAPVPKIKKNKEIEGKEFPENLNFSLYLTEDEFTREFGAERVPEFYTQKNPVHELTPQAGVSYTFSELISEAKVQGILKYSELYPNSACDILSDIEVLAAMLPHVKSDGVIDLEGALEVKKRKLEVES